MKGIFLLLSVIVLITQTIHASSDVLSLTSADFFQTVSENHLIAVEFFAPWCGHCKALAPEWEKVAVEMKGKVSLASVDCTENEDICQNFGVQGYPTLKLFRNGEPQPMEVNRKADDIIQYLNSELIPVPTVLNNQEEVEAFKTAHPVAVVVYFSSSEDPEYQTILTLAENLRHVAPMGAVLGGSSNVGDKKIVLFRSFDDNKLVYEGEFNVPAITLWIARGKVPLLGEIGAENYKDYVATELPIGYLLIDANQDNTELLAKTKVAAENVKSKAVLAWIDSNKYGQQAKRLGLSGDVVPALVVDDQTVGYRYIYPESQPLLGETEDVASWLEQYAEGKVEPYIKSEPIPETNDQPVKVIVTKSFDNIVKDPTKDVLVEFYAPWCGHCKNLAPVYDQLGEHFKDSSNVVIGKMDATANDVHPSYNVRGFPTILLFPASAKDTPIPYQGSRELDDLIKFVSNSGKEVEEEEEEEEEEDDNVHDEL